MEQSERRNLRIGILVDGFIQPRWVLRIIQDIGDASLGEIVLVIQNVAERKGNKGFLQRLVTARSNLLWSLYIRLDELLFRLSDSSLEEIDISHLLEDCPRLLVSPIQKGYFDYFDAEDVNEILSHNLDVALRFGFRIIKGDALAIARYGIWSYHHDDNLLYRGGPAGFWEILHNRPVTGSILQILTPDLDRGKVVYRSWSQTKAYSLTQNREECYRKSAQFVMRKLRDLQVRGESALKEDPTRLEFVPYSAPLYKVPTNREMLPFLTRIVGRMVAQKFRQYLYREQWCIAYKIDSSGLPADHFYDFQYVTPPVDRFWADPFPVSCGMKHFIFLEEFMYKTWKGHISVIEIDENGILSPPRKVLERDYHLSYPFVFKWRDTYYMIPESHKNRSIELYRCIDFPDRWELDRVLMEDVIAVDATLYQDEGVWWMFVNMASEGESLNDELHLFFADSPLGPWHEHRANPVRSDVRCARPAGLLFRYNDHLYRPGQDCSKWYGYAVSLNKVHGLDRSTYSEEVVGKIEPMWRNDIHGVHTFGHAGKLTVIDCLKYRPRFW